MKKLLYSLIAIFITFGVRAQTFTPVHNYQAPDGLDVVKYFGIPYGPTPTLNGVNRPNGHPLFYNTTDSSLYLYSGNQWIIVGSGGSGIDSAALAGKVNYTDSVIKYVTPTQLAALHNNLNLYWPIYGNNTDTSIHFKNDSIPLLTYAPGADTSGTNVMDVPSKGWVLGRLSAAGDGSVTNVSANAPLSVTNPSTTPNIVADTSTAITGLTTLYQNGLKLSKSDTASMLSPYARSNALALKLNISDTASMLSPYLRGGNIAWPGTLYTSPTTGTVSGNIVTFTPSLASQSAYTLFGNNSGSSTTPSFFTNPFIDSIKVTTNSYQDSVFARKNGVFILQYVRNRVQTPGALTDGATITWDAKVNLSDSVVLGGNRTLAISNAVAGMYGILVVKQDATGSRTLTLPANSKVIGGGSGAITLTTTAAAKDILSFYFDGTFYYWTFGKNYN